MYIDFMREIKTVNSQQLCKAVDVRLPFNILQSNSACPYLFAFAFMLKIEQSCIDCTCLLAYNICMMV
jgi:hypothetical protein